MALLIEVWAQVREGSECMLLREAIVLDSPGTRSHRCSGSEKGVYEGSVTVIRYSTTGALSP
jgi:hypothetical protein